MERRLELAFENIQEARRLLQETISHQSSSRPSEVNTVNLPGNLQQRNIISINSTSSSATSSATTRSPGRNSPGVASSLQSGASSNGTPEISGIAAAGSSRRSDISSLSRESIIRANRPSALNIREGVPAALRRSSPYHQSNSGTRMEDRSDPRSRRGREPVRRPGQEWFHRFLCLRGPESNRTPSSTMKEYLMTQGLGEKTVTCLTTSSADELKKAIWEAFPPLEGIDFQLMKSNTNAQGKLLFPLNDTFRIPPMAVIRSVRVGIIYILPSIDVCSSQDLDDPETTENEQRDDTTSEGFSDIEVDRDADIIPSDLNILQDTSTAIAVSAAMPISVLSDNLIASATEFKTMDDFRLEIYSSNPGVQPIHLYREDLLTGAIAMYMKSKDLNLLLKPDVKFHLEPARDFGGVTKEYFNSALSLLINGKYDERYAVFEGTEGRKLPSIDSTLLRGGVFRAVGKLMAHALLHVGVAAFGICKAAAEYLLTEEVDSQFPFTISKEDVPSIEVQNCLDIIDDWGASEAVSEQNRRLLLEQAAIAGYNAPLTLANRIQFREALLFHSVIDVRKSQLDDIKVAFKEIGILHFLRGREYLIDAAFPPMSAITYTPETICRNIQYEGDNEEGVVQRTFESVINELDLDGLRKLLQCWTAWQFLPAEKLSVHVGNYNFSVSTCTNTIYVSNEMPEDVLKRTLGYYIECGSAGFGSI